MAENNTVIETGAQGAGQEPGQERTFTQEQVDRIVQERLARAKAQPPADYEELRAKAAKYDEAQEAAKSELERAEERAARAEAALEEANARMAHEALVAKVSGETGVPAALLHGSTEEELAASAAAVTKYVEAQRPAYPRDKGGAPGGGSPVTVDSIEKIRNPAERVRMRAAHADLYRR